mmetsp:Transcript_2811/g.8284  ORF Transcript_2811/g.8284 Transcript_2811/m.8284 type:complete len:203 (-) Transcript_2811:57-665(-)
MSLHLGMWRSAACWLKRRPQLGHSMRVSCSCAVCCTGSDESGMPFFSATMICLLARRAAWNCSCSIFHLGFLGRASPSRPEGPAGWRPAGARPAGALRWCREASRTILAASSVRRCLATSNLGLGFAALEHAPSWRARRDCANLRPQTAQGTRGSSGSASPLPPKGPPSPAPIHGGGAAALAPSPPPPPPGAKASGGRSSRL